MSDKYDDIKDLRLPTKKEENPGPQMRGYIGGVLIVKHTFQEHKLINQKYKVINGEPIWLVCGLEDFVEIPITCANYPENATHVVNMMDSLWTLRPSIYSAVIDHIDEFGGLHNLLRQKQEKFAEQLCVIVVQQSKRLIMEIMNKENNEHPSYSG